MNATAPDTADARALARAGRIVGFRSWLVYLPYNIAMTWGSGTRTGSLLGTHLALKYGSRFVRKAFLAIVSVFIVKFALDTFV